MLKDRKDTKNALTKSASDRKEIKLLVAIGFTPKMNATHYSSTRRNVYVEIPNRHVCEVSSGTTTHKVL